MQWLAKEGRPDVLGDVAILSVELGKPTEKSLKLLNKAIHSAKLNTDASVTVRSIPLKDLVIASFADSSWANMPGAKSQGGVVIFATTKKFFEHQKAETSMLDWRSRRSSCAQHRRTARVPDLAGNTGRASAA